MNPNQATILVALLIVFAIFFIVIPSIIVAIAVPVSVHKHKYMDFVEKYSSALHDVKEINKRYSFNMVPNYDMSHSYDNNDFYPTVSCEDYLIYQLQFANFQSKVKNAIKNAEINKKRFKSYKDELSKCKLGVYKKEIDGYKRNTLIKYEEKMVKETFYYPSVKFDLTVVLKRTDINGQPKEKKYYIFDSNEIERIINKVNNKRGAFYQDPEIWNSIVRVERAKVSHKMRFVIFERDHERCRYCGSRRDLEIDHIIPISKGGKSTLDNLQTLCHRCNVKKGNSIY